MVFYFEGREGAKIYMGKDKFENEHLIKYGWPEDIWFHVDDLSSAHVYLRLEKGPIRKTFREAGNLDHAPDLLQDCCQLVKANSIEGSKKSAVDIVYTEWENLRKTGDMADGQVGFKDQKKVIKVRNVEKDREIIKRIEKTRTEAYPDLAQQRKDRDSEEISARKAVQRKQAEVKALEKKRMQEEADKRDYGKHLMKPELMTSNADMKSSKDTSAAVDFEEDFM